MMPLFQKGKDILSSNKNNITIESLAGAELLKNKVTLSMLRLDKIHPYISGNKFFKLKYFLENAVANEHKIITFGGPFSNHLVATAQACKELEIECGGIIRGEEPKIISHSLNFCLQAGMKLKFISRNDYDLSHKSAELVEFTEHFKPYILIPEGGYGIRGMNGAATIKDFYKNSFTHICCAVGSATTIAGLISVSSNEHVIGINITKDLSDIKNRLNFLLKDIVKNNYSLFNDYHFGGYAKSNSKLYNFMNNLYVKYRIPTDFVYTAKMMFGVFDLINKDYFPPGSKILCIHTGGLQGNLSLPKELLLF